MTNLSKEMIMTSKTNREIRKDVSRFSGLCLLYTLAMYAVITVYSVAVLSIFMYQHREGDLQVGKEVAARFLENDGGMYLCAVPVGLFIFWLYRKKQLFSSDLRHKKRAMTPKTFMILISLLLLGQTTFNLFSQFFEAFLNIFGLSLMSSVEAASADSTTWTMFLYGAIVGPISEELIFRVAGLRTFEKYGKVFAIFVSSLLFGIFHGNLPQIVFATFVGFVFAYVALEYSIFWAIGLHIFNNLVLGDGLSLLYSYLPENMVDSLHTILLYGGSALAIYFLFSLRKEISAYIESNKPETGSFASAFMSAWFWLFTLFMVGNAIYMLFL